eukprot:m.91976 g.91976  ORF g.91976 m.91976 type:complete len:145 (-) comp9936_c0_seq1:2706-3140(-)
MADWALTMCGPAGDVHIALLSAAGFASLLMGALKLDGSPTMDGYSWWTVFAPLIASCATSLYIYVITIVRLKNDVLTRHLKNVTLQIMPHFVFMTLNLILFILLARYMEEGDINITVAFIPAYFFFFITFSLPSGLSVTQQEHD